MPAPARLYKTEAIIIRQRKLGEADRILTLYTPALGKLDAKAKGVRKTTTRLGGHLQPLNRVVVQLAQGHTADVITGVETLDSFRGLHEDLDLLSRGLYIAELADRITPEHVHSFPTYRLLFDTLTRLDSPVRTGALTRESRRSDPDQALRFFEMRLLDQSGFRPELDRCAGCQRDVEPVDNFFAPVAGGVVCRACVPGLAGPRVLTLNALKLLRLMQRGSYNDLARVNVPADLADEVERHLRSYIITVLERDVNAAAFIERLRRDGARVTAQA
jgi:DNA repair protein RecO (recombination protein O)